MPSHLHENLVEMFRERPSLAAELLTETFKDPVPTFDTAEVSPADLNVVQPTELRADLVIQLFRNGKVVLAVIVEVQLGRPKQKRQSWPGYLGSLHARMGCPVTLLVICTSATTASWAARPIPFMWPNLPVIPLVVGPRQLSPITDHEVARRIPQLTIFSVLAHGNEAGPLQKPILEAALPALDALDPDHAQRYADLILHLMRGSAHFYLEELMTTTSYRYKSSFARRYVAEGKAEGIAEGKAEGIAEGKAEGIAEGIAEGKAEGKAEAVITFLGARGVEVTADVRERITTCTDPDQLDVWIIRAATVTTADDLFR